MKYSMNATYNTIGLITFFGGIVCFLWAFLTDSSWFVKTPAIILIVIAPLVMYFILNFHIIIEDAYIQAFTGFLQRKFRFEDMSSVHGIGKGWDNLEYVDKFGRRKVFLPVTFIKNRKEFNEALKSALIKHGIPFD